MSQANSTDIKSAFQAVRSWIAKIVGLPVLTIVVVFGAMDLLSDGVTIEPIEVPKSLSDIGYTPSIASHRLRDALHAYAAFVEAERTSRAAHRASVVHEDDSLGSNLDLQLSESQEVPDIVIPQIGLPLRTVMPYMRSALHRPGYAISGELTTRDGRYALRLRVNGRPVFSQNLEAETPDDLMTKAAPDVINFIRPAAYAIAHYGNQEKKESLRSADQIIAHSKSDIDVQLAYLLKGNHALQDNNFREAEEMLSLAESAHRNREQPLLQQGIVLLRQAKTEEAIKRFRRVIGINSDSSIAYNNIGVAQMSQAKQDKPTLRIAKLDDAIANFKKATEIDPGYGVAFNNLGLALFNRGYIGQAIEKYRRAIFIDNDNLLARWNLGFALQEVTRFDEAAEEYRKAISLTTDRQQLAELHTYLGNVIVLRKKAGENDQLEDAIEEYRAAIDSVRPRCYSWAHNGLGMVWKELNKPDNALAEFHTAWVCDQQNDQDHPEITENLIQAQGTKHGGPIKAASLTDPY